MQSGLDICSLAVSRLWGRRLPPSEFPKLNTLAGLPVELLLSITDFLPLDGWVCISLCNRRLFAIFNHRINSAPLLGVDKLPVLLRLERDLPPNYFTCHICHILHKYDDYDGSECFGLSGSVYDLVYCPLPCIKKWKEGPARLEFRLSEPGPIGFHVYHRVFFLHIQLAMKRCCYGEKYGISTEALSYTQVRTYSDEPEFTSLFSTDAHMHPEILGLCIRTQHMVFVHCSKPKLLLSRPKITDAKDPSEIIYICAHVSRLRRAELLDLVVNAYLTGEKGPSYTFTCEKCNTVCLIEVCEYGSDLALALTTWINLGPVLTPDDPRWKIYCNSPDASEVTLDPNDLKDSPRVLFENVSPQSLEALRSCNLSYLKGQRYKKVMSLLHWHKSIWYLPTNDFWGSHWKYGRTHLAIICSCGYLSACFLLTCLIIAIVHYYG